MIKELFLLFVFLNAICTQMTLNRRAKQKSSNAAGNFSMDNLQDFEYYATLSFGTPKQTGVKIVFDTGSDQLWIADTTGYDYNSNKSSSANVTDKSGELSYGKGSVSGYMGTELMFVPQLGLENLTMSTLFATTMEEMGNQTDGLLGLGAADNIDFVQVAHNMGQLPDALFAFDLRNQDVETLFFAGSTSFPTNDKVSNLHWMDTDWGMYKRWMITIKNTKVDGTTSHQELWNERAVIDTGTSLLLMGDNGAKLLNADSAIKQNCQYNSQQELYVCTCGKNYPNIYFESGTGYEFVVVPDDYMIKLSGSESYCVLGAIKSPLPAIEFPMMIFGDAFMRNYFVAYDKSKKQVGFSEPESKGTEKSFLK